MAVFHLLITPSGVQGYVPSQRVGVPEVNVITALVSGTKVCEFRNPP